MKSLLPATLAAAMLLNGCATDDMLVEPSDTAEGKADQISGADDPSGILQNAERRLSALISTADIGKTFGVPNASVPYPDTYWPMVDNGIAATWLESNGAKCGAVNSCVSPQPSPLQKLVSMTQPSQVQKAIQWEIKNHGSQVPNVASWFGHCPGWVATSLLYPPIPGPLHVRFTGTQFEKCAAGSAGCTKFEIGDLNALGAEAHEGAVSKFIGARCDTAPTDIQRDQFGRIIRNGTGCKGLNAGAMMIIMGNQLKMKQKPFAIDAQNEANTDEIWNQPAYRYTVHRFQALSELQAANLVATGGADVEGPLTDYIFNTKAQGFAFLDVSLHWVAETPGPNTKVVSGLSTTNKTRMVAIIELDKPINDASAVIVGGEYLDDESVGANRLRNAPFAWIALDAGSDNAHNPFVRKNEVKALLNMALSGGGGGGGGETCEHPVCSVGDALAASCDSCAATVCAADAFCCQNSWDAQCVNEAAQMCGLSCN